MSHSPTYNPYGAYELKRSYQRNLTLATLSVLGLVAVILGISWAAGGLDRDEMVTITRRDVDRTVHVTTAMMQPPKPVKRSVTAPKPKQPKDLGITDKIQVAPDAPEPMPIDSQLVYSDTSTASGDSVQSYSDLIGDSGVGVYPPASLPVATPDTQSVVPCSVILAVPPEYPWVARERKKEGVAGLIVCIDETGKVSLFPDDVTKAFQAKHLTVEKASAKVDGQKRTFNYVVTMEDPPGWFFAKKVADILPQWVFAPSTVDGQVVKSLVPIGHAFCLTGDCEREYKELRNYKLYSSVGTR